MYRVFRPVTMIFTHTVPRSSEPSATFATHNHLYSMTSKQLAYDVVCLNIHAFQDCDKLLCQKIHEDPCMAHINSQLFCQFAMILHYLVGPRFDFNITLGLFIRMIFSCLSKFPSQIHLVCPTVQLTVSNLQHFSSGAVKCPTQLIKLLCFDQCKST